MFWKLLENLMYVFGRTLGRCNAIGWRLGSKEELISNVVIPDRRKEDHYYSECGFDANKTALCLGSQDG